MPGEITIQLTDRECEVLAELSNMTDLPQDRVMIQALRVYQSVMCPVADISKCDAHAHNAWVESLKRDVTFEPLRDFLDRLKE